MKSQLFDIRREYKKGRLTPGNLNDNPLEQFDHWLNDAIHSDEYEPTAMTVATVSTDGHPSTRTVLLKGVENGRFFFFAHTHMRKWPFHLLHQLRKQKRPATDCKSVYILIFRMAQTGKANTH